MSATNQPRVRRSFNPTSGSNTLVQCFHDERYWWSTLKTLFGPTQNWSIRRIQDDADFAGIVEGVTAINIYDDDTYDIRGIIDKSYEEIWVFEDTTPYSGVWYSGDTNLCVYQKDDGARTLVKTWANREMVGCSGSFQGDLYIIFAWKDAGVPKLDLVRYDPTDDVETTCFSFPTTDWTDIDSTYTATLFAFAPVQRLLRNSVSGIEVFSRLILASEFHLASSLFVMRDGIVVHCIVYEDGDQQPQSGLALATYRYGFITLPFPTGTNGLAAGEAPSGAAETNMGAVLGLSDHATEIYPEDGHASANYRIYWPSPFWQMPDGKIGVAAWNYLYEGVPVG